MQELSEGLGQDHRRELRDQIHSHLIEHALLAVLDLLEST